MNLKRLDAMLEGYPKYRLKQARQSVFVELITDWQNNTTLPLPLREQLNAECPLDLDVTIFGSKNSDSIKILLRLEDGEQIESVLLKHGDGRRTVCVSSQAGCPLGCKFCATGHMGFRRNLTVDEIVSQVLFFARYLKKNEDKNKRVTNVVFMGMGEPLLNYENVLAAIRLLNDKDAFDIGARRISVSTCGIIEGIEKIIKEDIQINLAISLHASTDSLRSELMPINKKYPLSELMREAGKYVHIKKRDIMFEYLLIKGVNDREEDALALAKIMQDRLFVVNLIRYNPTGTFEPSNAVEIMRFKDILARRGINVTQRYSFGQDISAACGQLANRTKIGRK